MHKWSEFDGKKTIQPSEYLSSILQLLKVDVCRVLKSRFKAEFGIELSLKLQRMSHTAFEQPHL